MISAALPFFLAVLVGGSIVHCGLAILAAARYRKRRAEPSRDMPFVSVLIAVKEAGQDPCENLCSFFEQDYPEFEVLLAVPSEDDPAIRVAREIMALYSETSSRLVIGEETAEARYDLFVFADSGVRVSPDLLRVIASEMADPDVQVLACPARANAGISIWTALEAIGLNTEFLAHVLVSQMLRPMDFAFGPTLAVRRDALKAIEGFEELPRHLPPELAIGNRVARLGGRVALSRFVVERQLGAQAFRPNFAHRLRRARGIRLAGPRRYLLEVFSRPIPLAVLLVLAAPRFWPLFVLAVIARFWCGYATSQKILHDPLTRDLWYLLPFQDCLSFIVWIAGFRGSRARVG